MIARGHQLTKLVVGFVLLGGGCSVYDGLGVLGDPDAGPGKTLDQSMVGDGPPSEGGAALDAGDLAWRGDLAQKEDANPVDLSGLDVDALPSGVTQGLCHGCAWRGGRAFCWGANQFGELGDNSRTSRPSAMPVAKLDTVVQMSVGCGSPTFNGHTCAVTAAQEVWCWGSNEIGQIGDQSGLDQLTPVKVHALPAMASVSLGPRHTCALAVDGRVFCWGSNQALTVGDNTAFDRPAPTQALGLADAVSISAGYAHNCALRATQEVACWGANPYGECGTGNTFGVGKPTNMVGIDDALAVTAGENHTCVIRSGGTAWCMGNGEYGGLGSGSTPKYQTTPLQVLLPFTPVEIASAFADCARDATGQVACWGSAVNPTTGLLVTHSSPEPVAISDAQSLGGFCAERPAGLVSCWGFNSNGQVGSGDQMSQAAPVSVQGLAW